MFAEAFTTQGPFAPVACPDCGTEMVLKCAGSDGEAVSRFYRCQCGATLALAG